MRHALILMALGAATPARADYHALFKALVETDTTLATGSCTAAARTMHAAMADSGFPARDLHPYGVPDHPEEGGLVAILPGSGAGAVLMVAHIDVVEADRADWARDPFTLIEEGGYFYGRGVSDNKAMAAALVDALIRLRTEGFRPARSIKIALTCGEESPDAFNGAAWLAEQGRSLIDADIAFIPSGGGVLDAAGRHRSLMIQAGEKVQQIFRIEASAPPSHASQPKADNAIHRLAGALRTLQAVRFPVRLGALTRRQLADARGDADPPTAQAITAFLADPADTAAEAVVSADPARDAILRTTCVPVTIDTGRQANSVAPRAIATINCRLLPGTPVAEVQATLTAALAAPGIVVTPLPPIGEDAPVPPLPPRTLAQIEGLAQAMWPGVAVRPTLFTGATDARHFNRAGIPTYGLTMLFNDPDGNGVHGVNERIRVRSVEQGRAFVERLMRISSQPDNGQ